ncbi:hypothetical protein AYI70_g1143, partial [Smittium culicis]
MDAIPNMEEDFFRSPLTDKERKEIIYGQAKFAGMKYQPPPLNDAAAPAVKNVDSMLYSIQSSLALITRPLEQYVHDQLRRNRQFSDENSEDLDLICLEDASPYLSLRGANLPTANEAAPDDTPPPIQEEGVKRGQQSHLIGNSEPPIQESHRGSNSEDSGFLQPTLHYSQEKWRPQTSLRPEESERAHRTTLVQNGDTQIDLPDAQEERLDVVYRFERCLSPHSDTPEVQKISQIPMEWEDI